MNWKHFLYSICITIGFLCLGGICHSQIPNGTVDVCIIFDNYTVNEELSTDWGFGAVIKTPSNTILFDTGGNRSLLLANMEKMKINPKEINIVILSHVHQDHVGGLDGFLSINNDVEVYIPVSFPDHIRNNIQSHNASYHDVAESQQICSYVYTTGELGDQIIEQSVILDTKEGLVIITGCAHPGIVNITRQTKQIFPTKNVHLIMGGFHLLRHSDPNLRNILEKLRQLGVKQVAPSHCSGGRTRILFEEEYKDNYIDSGAGKKYTFAL